MGCFQSKAVEIDVPPTLPVAAAPAVQARMTPAPPPAPVPAPPPVLEGSSPVTVSRTRSRRTSTRERQPAHQEESILQARKRAASAPQRPPQALQIQDISQATSSSSQPKRPRTKSASAPRGHRRSQSNTPVPELPKPAGRAPSMSYPGGKSLIPMVRQMLPDHPRFRILVVGKRGSGKSSLISNVFKVDMSAVLQNSSGKSDINFAFRPDDNRYLIVHECSGFERGSAYGLQTIRNFITHRTDPSRSVPEKLHAVWICIPMTDILSKNIGEGIEDILATKGVPVVIAITKFDVVVHQLLFESEGGNSQYLGRARARAYTQCEQSCRSLFHRELRDVPAVILSVKSQFRDLVDNLIATTDRFIMGSRAASNPSSRGAKPRIAPVPLTWSAALRVSPDIIIQASVEVGRSRYWRSLWSSMDFADQTLKNCVNIIHTDIVEIWNLNDRTRCLMSPELMEKMSHIVKDLAGSAGGVPLSSDPSGSGDKAAEWVYDVYRGSPENVRCMMGYIVDLTVILDDIFRTAGGTASVNEAQSAVNRHVRSGRRDRIHREIRSFVTEAFAIRFTVPQKDLILEKIIDLIRQYCSPPSANG
ncbi:hypothetical protein BJV74DRAFT_860762 [Russula compacta]|nr:hypothetical protein BJV74DRAFT_860762 [Russula compacta]